MVVRMVGTAQDITEWKQLQEEVQQAQMEAVRRLAEGIAHEFNNLLTIIGGYALGAVEDRRESSARTDLREVRNASASAAALTRQLLMLNGAQPRERPRRFERTSFRISRTCCGARWASAFRSSRACRCVCDRCRGSTPSCGRRS